MNDGIIDDTEGRAGFIKTQRDYYNYSGAGPVAAEILEIRTRPGETYAVLLDKTIFYPEGGGQPGDRGTINSLPLIDVIEENGEILHLISVESNSPPETIASLKPGKAELALDWSRRRDFSSAHTGQHLLSGILYRQFQIPTVSVHLGDEFCFIDIKCPEIKEDKIIEAEDAVMDAIEKNVRVLVHICLPEDSNSFPLRKSPPKTAEAIRILEIEGVDFSPCCGTHLKSTGEILMLRILAAEKYKGMTRLSFIAGRRCLYDSRRLRKNADIISHALSVPAGETGRGVLEFLEKTRALEEELKVFKTEAVRNKAEALAKKAGSNKAGAIIIESYKEGMSEVINTGKAAQKLCSAVLLLVSEKENKFAVFCGQKEIDIRPFFKDKFEELGGKGGGGPSFFQGSFSSEKTLAAFLESIATRKTDG